MTDFPIRLKISTLHGIVLKGVCRKNDRFIEVSSESDNISVKLSYDIVGENLYVTYGGEMSYTLELVPGKRSITEIDSPFGAMTLTHTTTALDFSESDRGLEWKAEYLIVGKGVRDSVTITVMPDEEDIL